MKTYLVVWFNSDGATPSDVTNRVMSLGFRATHGNYDYVYDWGEHASTDDVLKMGDKLKQTLQGYNVLFKLESI